MPFRFLMIKHLLKNAARHSRPSPALQGRGEFGCRFRCPPPAHHQFRAFLLSQELLKAEQWLNSSCPSCSLELCSLPSSCQIFWGAGPVGHQEKEEGSVAEAAAEEKPASSSALKKLGRHRRNIAYYKNVPDFWVWYKYYVDTHNQEGIENMDQLYRTYLQNKHRVEEGRSYNHYLSHLSEIYKACANSDDPDCIAESTSKPTAKVVMPAHFRQAKVQVCNPYLDPYCLYGYYGQAPSEGPSPAPIKTAAPILSPFLPLPLKAPLGYYYAPVMESFLSAEQKAELLRICDPSDTECLQYHLRAAYGYKPALGPAPSYAHLSCDPRVDPYCRPTLVAKGPSGLYHLYPHCDPAVDPLCVTNVAPAAQSAGTEEASSHYCNPLFDKDCNPLSAAKLAALTKPVLEYAPKDQPAPLNLACDPRYDPYCLIGGTAALLKSPPLLPQFQSRSQLGVRGKTKEGYDCYVYYDKDCTPLEAHELKASPVSTKPDCHPYDPNCGKIAPQGFAAGVAAANTVRDGIIQPHPDCDPEIDFNCRLRRAGPAANGMQGDEPQDEPAKQESDQEEPNTSDTASENVLRAYLSQYKK
uniref:Actinodin2 n=1 Tax=Astyanax mexicanus TaxID=7994 RepID=W5L495_ASTMX